MNQHLFVSCVGELFDTRDVDWYRKPALRPIYQRHFSTISNAHQFKAVLRADRFTWPGGYPMYLICQDGEALCFECARKNAREIISAIRNRNAPDWRVTMLDINYEDVDLECAHCNKPIESAYGEVEVDASET